MQSSWGMCLRVTRLRPFSLLTALFASQDIVIVPFSHFYDVFYLSFPLSLEKKGGEWWRSWLWSSHIEPGSSWGTVSDESCRLTWQRWQMEWEDCVLGEDHRFAKKEHYPGYQLTVLEYLWFRSFLDNKS